MLVREKALQIALAEARRHVHEQGGNNRGPDVRKYLREVGLGEGYAWCDAFVSWCLHQSAGREIPTESAGVAVSGNIAARLKWIVARPARGDVFLADFDGDGQKDDHTGFVYRVLAVSANSVTAQTVEGNTSSGKAGSQADGDGVFLRTRTFDRRRVTFYRVPGNVPDKPLPQPKPKKLTDVQLVIRMKRYGIVNPVWTLKAARKAGLPIALACAMLEQESGGGRNVFGHDKSIFCGAGKVTKAKYLAYRKQRGAHGSGGMQGVGPMQLTWWSLQAAADQEGGCWKPLPNMTVGFRHAAELVRRSGMRRGIAAYNGAGPAAERYADSVMRKAHVWAARLHRPF